MAGLMQNIGAVYLSRIEPELYEDMFKKQNVNPVSAYQAELDHYDTSHCFLGSLICKKWHIDSTIYKSILLHHDKDFIRHSKNNQKLQHIIALTMLSNFIVASCNEEQYITQEMKEYRTLAQNILQLPENAFAAARSAVNKWGSSSCLISASH